MAGHPILPAGFNEDPIAWDEVDGAGTNGPISPVYFDTFEALFVFLIDAEMLDIFETGDPDYTIPCPEEAVLFPCELRELEVSGGYPEYVALRGGNTIVFPSEVRELVIRGQQTGYAAPRPDRMVDLSVAADETDVRRQP